MKQTNNAIKFLMAQYRAIFKNAYFKGLTSAVLLTAGMAVAGGAQAAGSLQLGGLATEGELSVTGNASASTDDEFQNIAVEISSGTEHPWRADVVVTSGAAGNQNGNNYILQNGSDDTTLSGRGSLTINGEDTTTGVLVKSYNDNGDLTLDLRAVNVAVGTLDVQDANSSTASGAMTIAADEITIGGNGLDNNDSATALVKLTSSANQSDWKGVTLGRAGVENATDSVITVDDGGVVLMSATNSGKDETSIVGQSLTVNEGGLIVTSGSGSNTIASRMTQVDGGLMVSGATTVTSHETVVNGNLLVSGGYLSFAPAAVDTNNDDIIEAGTVTIGSGANVQIADFITLVSEANGNNGHLIIEDGASVVATDNTATNDGSIRIVGATTDIDTNYTNKGPKLTIGSATLKTYLNYDGSNKYDKLSYNSTNNTLTSATDTNPDAALTSAAKGAVFLNKGGVLEFSDEQNVNLNNFYFTSGTTVQTSSVGTIVVGTSGGIVKGKDLTVQNTLEKSSGYDVDTGLKLYLEADNLTLGSSTYSGNTSLGFEAARVQDNLNLVASGDTFILADTINADRKYFVQGTDADGDPINTTTLNGTGTITGDNIQIGSGSTSGALNIVGGAWTSDSNITIVSGSLAVKADAADNTPNWVNNKLGQ